MAQESLLDAIIECAVGHGAGAGSVVARTRPQAHRQCALPRVRMTLVPRWPRSGASAVLSQNPLKARLPGVVGVRRFARDAKAARPPPMLTSGLARTSSCRV
jgi:hypothetical protein